MMCRLDISERPTLGLPMVSRYPMAEEAFHRRRSYAERSLELPTVQDGLGGIEVSRLRFLPEEFAVPK